MEKFYLNKELKNATKFGYKGKSYELRNPRDIGSILVNLGEPSAIYEFINANDNNQIIIGEEYFESYDETLSEAFYLNDILSKTTKFGYKGKIYNICNEKDIICILIDIGGIELSKKFIYDYDNKNSNIIIGKEYFECNSAVESNTKEDTNCSSKKENKKDEESNDVFGLLGSIAFACGIMGTSLVGVEYWLGSPFSLSKTSTAYPSLSTLATTCAPTASAFSGVEEPIGVVIFDNNKTLDKPNTSKIEMDAQKVYDQFLKLKKKPDASKEELKYKKQIIEEIRQIAPEDDLMKWLDELQNYLAAKEKNEKENLKIFDNYCKKIRR